MSLQLTTSGSPPAHSPLSWRPWAVSISVAIAFFLAAHLSLALLDKADGVAVFWPAAGVATGVLVAFGAAVPTAVPTESSSAHTAATADNRRPTM